MLSVPSLSQKKQPVWQNGRVNEAVASWTNSKFPTSVKVKSAISKLRNDEDRISVYPTVKIFYE
tara:strand:+ start:617 stop:808 length:192 start_codon:yes stop_codon:yes gene_type:complete